MIQLRGIFLEVANECVRDLNLTVVDGEVFCLLCKHGKIRQHLFSVLRGFSTPDRGEIAFSRPAAPGDRNVVAMEALNAGDFDAEATLAAHLRLLCRAFRLKRETVYENLIQLNVGEEHLRKRLQNAEEESFRKLVLAVQLAIPAANLVINDFIRQERKSFEMAFNKLLLRRREWGQAILYLTDDIFYALRIADRVAFIKKGRLLPREPILAADLEEMDLMRLYEKFLG